MRVKFLYMKQLTALKTATSSWSFMISIFLSMKSWRPKREWKAEIGSAWWKATLYSPADILHTSFIHSQTFLARSSSYSARFLFSSSRVNPNPFGRDILTRSIVFSKRAQSGTLAGLRVDLLCSCPLKDLNTHPLNTSTYITIQSPKRLCVGQRTGWNKDKRATDCLLWGWISKYSIYYFNDGNRAAIPCLGQIQTLFSWTITQDHNVQNFRDKNLVVYFYGRGVTLNVSCVNKRHNWV